MSARETAQSTALQMAKDYKRVILSWSTGVGKSYVGIKLFQFLLSCKTDSRFLIVVAETAHKKNWCDEIIKHLGEKNGNILIRHTDIVCYASLKKVCTNKYKGIIFDEAHHLNSEIRLELLTFMSAEYVICMSATMTGRKFSTLRSTLDLTFGKFLVSKIGLQDAIDSSIIPKPDIVTVPLTLSRMPNSATLIKEWGKKEKRVVIHCDFNDRFKYISNKATYPNVKLMVSCSQYEMYQDLCGEFEYYKKKALMNPSNEFLRNKWLQIGSQRKRFLGDMKLEKALKLVQAVRKADKRFICYCNSVLQAELLGGRNCIHSKKRGNQYIIDSFNSGKISELFAVNMGQEGLNLRDIEVGILVQLDGEERGWIQKSGRIYRAQRPVIYVFYVKDTRDEEYFKSAIDGIKPEYIREITWL